jgi:hypothetical protein
MRFKNLEIKWHRPLAAPKQEGVPVAHPTLAARWANYGWAPLRIRTVPDTAPPAPAPMRLAVLPGPKLDVDDGFRAALLSAEAPVQDALAKEAASVKGYEEALASLRTHLAPPVHLHNTTIKLPPVYRHNASFGAEALARTSSDSSQDSADTIIRKEATFATGRADQLHLKAGGRDRLLASVPERRRRALASVLEQIKAANKITTLSLPSATSEGMASVAVSIEDGDRLAFVNFTADGRITSVDVTDPSTFESEFGAVDSAPGPGASASTSAGASTAAVPPLMPPPGLTPRIDVSSQVQRSDAANGVVRYTYQPRGPDVLHGIQVHARPNGSLLLHQISTRPELRSTLGSGTDMVLGVVKNLNEDGYQVKEIEAAWTQTAGLESQYTAFAQSMTRGLSYQDAARQTFSGKAAAMFGFTEVQVEQSFYGHYIAKFTRPVNAASATD